MYFKKIHHIAIICSDYEKSKNFYTKLLGLEIIRETYREEKKSYKLDLKLSDGAQIELFTFPDALPRPSRPEAHGLRHLAFAVDDLDQCLSHFQNVGIAYEEVRIDDLTNKRFTFFSDPDQLPLEIYET
ncbi:MAG: VOC family protein [Bacteriovoracaceae bacterium]